MDMQYNEKFIVKIYQEKIGYEGICEFYDNEEEYYKSNNFLIIKENFETEISFSCMNSTARLYMDGIETIQQNFTNEDENGEVYLMPSNNRITLYDTNNFPLIPGYFRIRLVIDNKEYFSKIRVKPKLVTEDELKNMKDDLEKEINGLAFELIKKNITIGEANINYLPKELYSFLIIKNNFSKLMFALQDIKIRPNYKISKNYRIVKEDELKSIDEITIRSYLEGSIEKEFFKEPIIELDYNLPENQWIKKLIKEIEKYLNRFIEVSDNFIDKKEVLVKELNQYRNNEVQIREEKRNINYIKSLIELAVKMKNSINMLNSMEWFKSVSSKLLINFSHTLFYDSRYNCIYKLYNELKNSNYSIELNNKYSFQWKRTDKLYEIWCFVKIARIILEEDIGFYIDSGWMFDNQVNDNRVLIPELDSGAKIRFKKNEFSLNLIYDEKLPYYSNKTDIYNMPIYITTTNNRPDGRIDIYKNEIYLGSIILEFKYRDRSSLWYKDYTKYQNQSGVIKQLTSYGDNCKSLYVFKSKNDPIYNKDFQPIRKVLIFYPKRTDRKEEIDEIEDHNLKFIRFRPDLRNDNVKNSIKEAIEELIDRSKSYID